MSGKAPLFAKRKYFLPKIIANGCDDWCYAYLYEGKFESTQIKLTLTGTVPLGGIGG